MILVRDLMGNCWSTVYINGEFISRCLDRDLLESEKVFMGIDDAAGTQFTIPLENPVLSPIIEGKFVSGEDNICLRHVRGREVTYDGLFISIWDPDITTPERVRDIDISGTVIPQNGLLHHIQYMPAEDMAGSDDNRGISEPHIARTIQPAYKVNGPPANTDVACAANKPAEDTDAGCAVVDKSRPPSGTIDNDGSRKIGRGMKRMATSRRGNGGTPTLAQRGTGGNGKGGRPPMACGRGRGRGRGQGGATMDGPGETRGRIGGSEGVLRRNRRPGKAAVAECADGFLHHILYMPAEDMADSDDNRGISEPHIARTIQPACKVNGPPANMDVACAANRPAEDTDAGCTVVDKSRPPSGTIDSDGSWKIGRGMKRKATSRRDNGGTPTLAQRETGGNGKGGRPPMARGRGRGRGRGQGGATMDGPGETRGRIGGSEGVQRRNRRPGEAAVAECAGCNASQTLASLTDHL
ncbi:hypothetical protein CBR_g17723 [Chara braunii]|uniref:Uncharacterized protein n=1 Tax=Chara braunii TaxID=69332 RepID=A0A388KVP3_CHABU|nr:hypothetical protein CBR_g17723 [Chara braunii]|eukprot:GBG74013.1 hypothetical protein CBR_g17723 [Chara braunii]